MNWSYVTDRFLCLVVFIFCHDGRMSVFCDDPLILRERPNRGSIYQIVDLLVDTCATTRKLLHIAGDDKPAEVVRSRFMKLNADHIRFVLKCLAENSSPIRNMKQYLLTSLYNAPTTMQLFYQNQTNHDLAIRR